jgi:heme/copper-type cytochrome/quinol oxidase subunit 2
MVFLNATHEIRTWMILLPIFGMIGLVVYILKITAKLRKYEKLNRSQSEITYSLSALTTKLNTALDEIKSIDKNSE